MGMIVSNELMSDAEQLNLSVHRVKLFKQMMIYSLSVDYGIHGDADATDTGVDTPATTTNTFSNEFSLSTEPE